MAENNLNYTEDVEIPGRGDLVRGLRYIFAGIERFISGEISDIKAFNDKIKICNDESQSDIADICPSCGRKLLYAYITHTGKLNKVEWVTTCDRCMGMFRKSSLEWKVMDTPQCPGCGGFLQYVCNDLRSNCEWMPRCKPCKKVYRKPGLGWKYINNKEGKEINFPLCPECGIPMNFIYNSNLENKIELLPHCHLCKKAHRNPALGWKLIGESDKNPDWGWLDIRGRREYDGYLKQF